MGKLLIIGSANEDILIRMDRLPESGESRWVQEVRRLPGGKGANQAAAAARLGAQVSFVGKIGEDDAGRRLMQALEESGVNTRMLKSSFPTGCAYVLLEENASNRILIDGGANNDFLKEDLPILKEMIREHDMLLLQLEINLDALEWILKTAREMEKPVIVDASPAKKGILKMFSGLEVLSPNETELKILTGKPCRSTEEQIQACRGLLKAGVRRVVLTLGERGALLVEENQVVFFAGHRVKALDPTGAGDAFTAGIAVGLLEGRGMEGAVEFATRAGALCVTRLGALNSMPTREAVEAMG